MAKCRACKAEIIFVQMETGGRMPLDAEPEKRVVLEALTSVGRVVSTYVSHFATCPNAEEFK